MKTLQRLTLLLGMMLGTTLLADAQTVSPKLLVLIPDYATAQREREKTALLKPVNEKPLIVLKVEPFPSHRDLAKKYARLEKQKTGRPIISPWILPKSGGLNIVSLCKYGIMEYARRELNKKKRKPVFGYPDSNDE